jgi:hypothetical protein
LTSFYQEAGNFSMAIDLGVRVHSSIKVSELRDGAVMTLSRVTACAIADIYISRITNGTTSEVSDDSSIVGDGLVIVGMKDYDVQVVLTMIPSVDVTNLYECSISAEYSRSPIEFVLALSCAIWLGKRCDSMIEDDWQFWSSAVSVSPETLESILGVGRSTTFVAACQQIVGNRVTRE